MGWWLDRMHRARIGGLVLCLLLFGLPDGRAAGSHDLKLFTIGTGGTAYTYYPLGGLIATAISKPPGSRPCDDGGSCGVDGLIGTAVSTRGSVENAFAITMGRRDSGFVQSDVAHWIYNGTGTMEGRRPERDLRAIAALYKEHLHLVTTRGSGIGSVSDLRGKRVSVDEPGSGTYLDARLVLAAAGIGDAEVEMATLRGNAAVRALEAGEIDAFFVIAGYPVNSLAPLADDGALALVPIDGPVADALLKQHRFFAASAIPADAYPGVPATKTIAVEALWLTSAEQDAQLIYEITRALWNRNTRRLLDEGHAKGAAITLDTALSGMGLPLHLGAVRYYREVGVLN